MGEHRSHVRGARAALVVLPASRCSASFARWGASVTYKACTLEFAYPGLGYVEQLRVILHSVKSLSLVNHVLAHVLLIRPISPRALQQSNGAGRGCFRALQLCVALYRINK